MKSRERSSALHLRKIMEYWSIGVLEYWSVGVKQLMIDD
jgi:hypothetical protein